MDDGRVYLDQLNTQSHNYKVKVKVLQKWKPKRSASNVLFQTVQLQDDKGNKMRGTLFGDQIGAHVDALVYNGVYEIANAPIRPPQLQFKKDPTELSYTMGFGGQTLIRPLASTTGTFLPEYQCVSQVPKTANPYDIFDVIGSLLYVEPTAREVPAKQGRKNLVREIILTDHNLEQPMVVSTWNDLAEDDCSQLASLVGNCPVVGLTALKISPHRGFSLTSTMSTAINTSPTGDKVAALTEWATQKKKQLLELQTKIRNVRELNAPISIITLNALKSKKAKNTLQDERYRVQVTVPNPSLQKVNAYLGCSHCGRQTDYAAGDRFTCENCTTEGVMSEPRITFNCEVADGTEQLEITAFTEDTVKLFHMSAPDIFHIKHSEDRLAFVTIQARLQNQPFTIEVSPKTALSRNNILQWGLRDVLPIPEQPAINLPLAQADDPKEAVAVNTSVKATPVARQLDFGSPPEEHSTLALVDVSISADYPSSRKLPASIIANTKKSQLQDVTTEQTVLRTKTNDQSTILPTTTPTSQTLQSLTEAIPEAVNIHILKSPKVEKIPACTPETPAQGTPKRNTGKQAAGSPAKKKKAGTSSSPGH